MRRRRPASTALALIAAARSVQPEALVKMHVLDEDKRLVGVVSVIALLQAEPGESVRALMESDPVRVGSDADLTDIALLMADYNLYAIPVVDGQDRMLGIVTVDDVLEATIPEDWRRREPAPRPVHEITDDDRNMPSSGAKGSEFSRAERRRRPPAAADRAQPHPATRTAVLDSAHLGDIEGAFGRISVGETDNARTWKTRLLTLLAIVGPGIIVMVGDNDAGGWPPTPRPAKTMAIRCCGCCCC